MIQRFPAAPRSAKPPRVVAVVTHVTDASRTTDAVVTRLRSTLDGLLESLGDNDLEIVVSTVRGRHVADLLPHYLSERVVVLEHPDEAPMFLGFEAQSVFAEHVDDADWFVYTEDDLVLNDGLVLGKLEYFESGAPADALLLPHRVEYWNGRKFYIDLLSKTGTSAVWSGLTALGIEDWRFAEFDNPHSGFYCLSKAQLTRLLATGRHWYGSISMSGPRESAATGCLAEAFRLYKPHPNNLAFLEIRHLGTKYAEFDAVAHSMVEADQARRP